MLLVCMVGFLETRTPKGLKVKQMKCVKFENRSEKYKKLKTKIK